MLGGDGFELRGFVAAAEEQHLTAFVGEQSCEPACVFDGPYLASVLGEGCDADGGRVLVGVEGDGVGVERGGVDGEAEAAEDVGVAQVLRAARAAAQVGEVEPTGDASFVDAAHFEWVEVEEGVELQEEQRPSHAVHLVEVGHGVGSDGFQLAVDVACGLFFLDSEEADVGLSFEEGLQHGWRGDGEEGVAVGGGDGLYDGSHEGYVAEGGEADDEYVLHRGVGGGGYFL